jgi:hypothetical protein
MTSKPVTPYGYTIFCDDIREEVSGKISYMGIYRSSLIVNGKLPVTLPKFCLAVSYVMRPEDVETLENDLEIKVFLPGGKGDAAAVMSVTREQMRATRAPHTDDPLLQIAANITFSPLELAQEGLIQVRAYNGATEWKLGALQVSERPEMDASPD